MAMNIEFTEIQYTRDVNNHNAHGTHRYFSQDEDSSEKETDHGLLNDRHACSAGPSSPLPAFGPPPPPPPPLSASPSSFSAWDTRARSPPLAEPGRARSQRYVTQMQ
eukprot:7391341-Prymnesium_polylepis.1